MGDPTTLERKLFLLAGGLPPSAPRRFGIKNTERAAEWELKPFKNVARADELELRHWVRKRKASDAVDEDGEVYPFVKYNVVIDVPEYTPEEYERHLRSKQRVGAACMDQAERVSGPQSTRSGARPRPTTSLTCVANTTVDGR